MQIKSWRQAQLSLKFLAAQDLIGNDEKLGELCEEISRILTCIGLNPRGNLSGTNIIEECDVLAQNSLQVTFTNALGVHFTGVYPDVHISVCADKHSDACQLDQLVNGEKRPSIFTDADKESRAPCG